MCLFSYKHTFISMVIFLLLTCHFLTNMTKYFIFLQMTDLTIFLFFATNKNVTQAVTSRSGSHHYQIHICVCG